MLERLNELQQKKKENKVVLMQNWCILQQDLVTLLLSLSP
jgi:hypothetical protein